MPVRALAFDADDTLWDFTSVMWESLAAAVAVFDERCPDHVGRLDDRTLLQVRDRLAAEVEAAGERVTLADVRRRSFRVALAELGIADPDGAVAAAMAEAYFVQRHGFVQLYPEVPAVLDELGARYVIGLVTNGNTDPERSGLPGVFDFRLAADHVGLRKPDPRLFLMAAAAAGCHPTELVSVGDQLDKDVAAPQSVGARGVWINRHGLACPPGLEPDATITDLCALPDVLARFDAEEADAAAAVGVGPHPEPWPEDPRFDPELLAGGDRRNVVDRYRYWREEAVAADLAARAHPFHVAVENWRSDHNIGAVVRNANAFGAAGVHIVGRRRWNRRGAMATDRYLPVHHHASIDDLVAWAVTEGLEVVGVDNVAGARPIESWPLPARCVLVFGQEGPGLSPGALAASSVVVSITQYGSTRSLNAGVASGIALHAWARTHAR